MLPTHPTLTVVIRRPLAVQPIFRICSVPFFCSQAHNNWCMVCIMSVYIYIFFETVNDWQLVFTPNCPISLFKHAHNSRHGPTKREGWNLIVKSFALKMYQIVFVFNGETVKQWYNEKIVRGYSQCSRAIPLKHEETSTVSTGFFRPKHRIWSFLSFQSNSKYIGREHHCRLGGNFEICCVHW